MEDLDGEADAEADEERIFSVALVGRPNVGKSTLFNRLIGEDRAVVHDLPAPPATRSTRSSRPTTARSASSTPPGMRRKAKIDEATEYYSLVRALQAVDQADVALLIIDSTVGVTAQDQRLAERIDAAGSPVVVLLNKHELLTDAEVRADLDYQIKERLRFIGEAPVLKISALTGKGVGKLMPALSMSIEDYHRRVPTRRVNEVIRAAQQAQPGPHGVKVLYATQAATDPPTFTLFANREVPADLPPLPRAQPPRGLRPRRHPHQDAGPQALLTVLWTPALAMRASASTDLVEEGGEPVELVVGGDVVDADARTTLSRPRCARSSWAEVAVLTRHVAALAAQPRLHVLGIHAVDREGRDRAEPLAAVADGHAGDVRQPSAEPGGEQRRCARRWRRCPSRARGRPRPRARCGAATSDSHISNRRASSRTS